MKGEGYLGKMLVPIEEYFYMTFRALVGWLFFMHGSSKIFGWFTERAAQATGSLMWFVGLAEVIAGILILLGLWTRLGAIIGAIVMVVAWFKAHVPSGWNPLANGGELALMFLIAFFVVLVHGSGKYGLEHWMKKKECI
ncbi:MAG: DoxX family protein [Candidatus Woesearchaeota archaeon]